MDELKKTLIEGMENARAQGHEISPYGGAWRNSGSSRPLCLLATVIMEEYNDNRGILGVITDKDNIACDYHQIAAKKLNIGLDEAIELEEGFMFGLTSTEYQKLGSSLRSFI